MAGVAKLPHRGIEFLWRAYELGHEAALWDLACCQATPDSSSQGYAINWALAVKLYEKHAEEGHPIALKNLGTCYYRGWGVEQNISKARELYEKSARHNYSVAQYNLGICYRQGDGVPEDLARMVELYQKAADQGLHAAQCALANCCLYGSGLPVDWHKSTALMTKAADGYPPAMVIIARWYEIGYGRLMPNIKKAMEYAVRAVYEKEEQSWGVFLRLLTRYYKEATKGPVEVVPSLFNLCCSFVYEREILGGCLLRNGLMKNRTAEVQVKELERRARWFMQHERARRERLLGALPTDVREKLLDDRLVCFLPSCSREFYGGRVVRQFVMKGSPADNNIKNGKKRSEEGYRDVRPRSDSLHGRYEVLLPFCSMACASSTLG